MERTGFSPCGPLLPSFAASKPRRSRRCDRIEARDSRYLGRANPAKNDTH